MNTKNEILDEVDKWLEGKVSDGYTEIEALEELQQHGCESGMVSGLIYYSDTTRFYEEHKSEIAEILRYVIEEHGMKSPVELFGDKWDELDSLALESNNQNLLAWFGFEQVAGNLLESIQEIELGV